MEIIDMFFARREALSLHDFNRQMHAVFGQHYVSFPITHVVGQHHFAQDTFVGVFRDKLRRSDLEAICKRHGCFVVQLNDKFAINSIGQTYNYVWIPMQWDDKFGHHTPVMSYDDCYCKKLLGTRDGFWKNKVPNFQPQNYKVLMEAAASCFV